MANYLKQRRGLAAFPTGCITCKCLNQEKVIDNTHYTGTRIKYSCSKRDISKFKTFPCARKLKCFEGDYPIIDY